MKLTTITLLIAVAALVAVPASVPAADDAKLKAATRDVESGAKQVGEGLETTAKGVGKTVTEGAKAPPRSQTA
jgi:hypothetical protein